MHQFSKILFFKNNYQIIISFWPIINFVTHKGPHIVLKFARPHIVSRFGRVEWGARGPSGRLASATLVIHVKYGMFIYLFIYIELQNEMEISTEI